MRAFKTFIFFFVTLVSFSQNTLTGKVVSITDGDTFTLLDENNQQIKIRLAEIDCPENSQPFGKAAKKYLGSLIFSKTVRVEFSEKDRYGRVIGKVFYGQLYISEEMIKAGYAWHFKKYSNSIKLANLETEARINKKGLWIDPGAVAPWEWRKKY